METFPWIRAGGVTMSVLALPGAAQSRRRSRSGGSPPSSARPQGRPPPTRRRPRTTPRAGAAPTAGR